MQIRAIIFDTFGTLVDWHSGVTREVSRLLISRTPHLDVNAFSVQWNDRIQSSMEPIRAGTRAWVDIDTLEAETLDDVLTEFGIKDVDAATKSELVLAWHRLDAWPEVPAALNRLLVNHLLAPVSNGHVRLIVDLARHNGFTWDAIFGAEFSRNYKPKPVVYCDAVAAFGFPANETLFVTASSDDIAGAAAACPSLATAHVARPHTQGSDMALKVPVTYVAADLADLAAQLGCSSVRTGIP